jgi:hypothetical protein
VVGVYSAAVTLLLAAGLATASHAQDLTDDEAKCQVGTSLAIGKFVTEKAKCLIKCEQGARKGLNPAADCVPPYAADTLTCVQKAGGKAESLEGSKAPRTVASVTRVVTARRTQPPAWQPPRGTSTSCARSSTATIRAVGTA